MCGRRPGQLLKPAPVAAAPALLGHGIVAVLAQHEAVDLLPDTYPCAHCGVTRTDEIAHRFVLDIAHPDRREITGTEPRGQQDRVAAIVLDAIAGLLRDKRWRDHVALKAALSDVPVQRVTTRARLVAKAKLVASLSQTIDQLVEGFEIVRQHAEILDIGLIRHRKCDRNSLLVNIHPDKHRHQRHHVLHRRDSAECRVSANTMGAHVAGDIGQRTCGLWAR